MFDRNNTVDKLGELSYEELGNLVYEVNQHFFDEKPVDIETFIYDERFLGNVAGKYIYPYWVNELKKIYPSPFYSPYNEEIVVAAKGSGKTWISAISIVYDLYYVMCYTYPQIYYGLTPDTNIYFTVFSLSKTLSKDTNFDNIKNFIVKCPWFSGKIREISLKDKSYTPIILSKNCIVEMGSLFKHAIGKAVYSGVMDEANFQSMRLDQAETNYNAITEGRRSRFLQKMSYLPGNIWVISSPADVTDFVNTRIEKSKNSPHVYINDMIPIWEVKKHRDLYCGETFKVFIGDSNSDPFVIDDSHDIINLDKSRIINVPVEYKDPFTKDLYDSMRDIAGVTMASNLTFFRSVDTLKAVMTGVHRFKKEVIQLDFYDEGDQLFRYVKDEYFSKIMYPEAVRFIHIDIGIAEDRLGMGSVFSIPHKHVVMLEDETVSKFFNRDYFVDFLLCIEAKHKQQIPITKIKEFINHLISLGYPIKMVTADKYNSANLLQDLKLMGLKTDFLSVDTSKDGYKLFRELVDESKIIVTKHSELYDELVNLVENKKKIDHKNTSSKDIADGVAGAVYSCFLNGVITDNMITRMDTNMGYMDDKVLKMLGKNPKGENVKGIVEMIKGGKYF